MTLSDPDQGRGERPVTDHLSRWGDDPKASLDQVLPWVAAELRRLAQSFLAGESKAHTLQATALVHELYLRLVERRRASWRDRSHFFGFAARTMRRILVDHARAQAAAKRGGDWVKVELCPELDGAEPWGAQLVEATPRLDLLALDHALRQLAELDPRLHEIVELRYFAGLTVPEIADALGVGTATVQRGWSAARAWLYLALGCSGRPEDPATETRALLESGASLPQGSGFG
ncbi:MAG: ECF-type sigma factor [Holophagales bacterium]|nr:ECF-type sigma factor [Holophagales bacterium]